MIAHAALVMKATFAPRFSSIQWILDSVEFFKKFWGNSGYIFKFLRLYVIFQLILCCVQILESGTVSLMYKLSLVQLRIKPRQTCQHLHIGNHTKPLKIMKSNISTVKPNINECNTILMIQDISICESIPTFSGLNNSFTVIQRRMNGNENFVRPWRDYVTGFGNPQGDFWLGLSRIYDLTSTGRH